LFIVLNSGSGHLDTETVRNLIVTELSSAGREHTLFIATRGRDVQKMAQQAVAAALKHSGHVVVAGGDGTINTVVNEAYRAKCAVGIIPLGTFNYTARHYGIPEEPAAATRAIVNGEIRRVSAGMVGGRVFLVNAGLGFHSYLLAQREKHKSKLGRSRLVALLSALVSISDLPTQFTLDLEHDARKEILTVAALFVGNNPLQLQQTGLLEGDQLPASSLLAVALRPIGPLQALGLFVRGAMGKLAHDEHLKVFPLHEMTVSRRNQKTRPFRVAVDGELHKMNTPLTFGVTPEPLCLLLPASTAP
jgi:diacylglycerol kinase family enzyme